MQIVTRAQWGARRPKSVTSFSPSRPCSGHWNGPTVTVQGKTTWGHEFCSALVRGIQNFHMDGRNWSDIAYNWLVCPHGVIYEGRGLRNRGAANGTNAGNASSPSICFLAGQGNNFTDAERVAFKDCTNYVAQNSGATPGAIGHRDHKATECPGDARYRWIHDKMPTPTKIEEIDMRFESHEARRNFVIKSFRSIAGRTPSEGEINWWVWTIAVSPTTAWDLILDLHAGEHKKVS